MKSFYPIFIFIVSLFVVSTTSDSYSKYTINNISKVWGKNNYKLITQQSELDCFKDYELYNSILLNNKEIGKIIIRKVNTCSTNGCSIESVKDSAASYENLVYLAVIDTLNKIKRVRVIEYNSSHGHQVTSPSWLNKLIKKDFTKDLKYGKDIDAIAGATTSAKALINDLDVLYNCLNK